jgi:SAM-dependent methyltransferase
MSAVSRRAITVQDRSRWVFNRLAADYVRRPPYPPALVARLLALAGGAGARIADLGAGTGHLAIPLARLGARVHAVEPARAMLDALATGAAGLGVVPVHAAGEDTGLPEGAFDLVLVADALHWIDAARGGAEIARLLAPGGGLAVVVPALADTPFLRALGALVVSRNPKARPRPADPVPLFATARLPPPAVERLLDEARLEGDALDAVIRSLSYAGPALGPTALAALLAEARSIADAHGGAAWTRELALWHARRAPNLLPNRQ